MCMFFILTCIYSCLVELEPRALKFGPSALLDPCFMFVSIKESGDASHL